jgi:hypothetical protein
LAVSYCPSGFAKEDRMYRTSADTPVLRQRIAQLTALLEDSRSKHANDANELLATRRMLLQAQAQIVAFWNFCTLVLGGGIITAVAFLWAPIDTARPFGNEGAGGMQENIVLPKDAETGADLDEPTVLRPNIALLYNPRLQTVIETSIGFSLDLRAGCP